MSINRIRRIVVAGLVLLALSVTAAAQARVETNVVYGMYSGTRHCCWTSTIQSSRMASVSSSFPGVAGMRRWAIRLHR